MTESIHTLLQSLPETSLTTRVLGALDYLAPGEWQNVTSFEKMVELVTGETDPAVVQAVGEKALQLWFDESTGYQRAASVFKLVDSESTFAGAASMASLAGSQFELLSFLKDVTPKPDTVQAIDAGMKFAAELTAFCLMNGLPGDSIGEFVHPLVSAGKEDAMSLSAWIVLDVVLPLGPDGLSKLIGAVQSVTESEFAQSRVFRLVADHLPGGFAEKKQLVSSALRGRAIGDRGQNPESGHHPGRSSCQGARVRRCRGRQARFRRRGARPHEQLLRAHGHPDRGPPPRPARVRRDLVIRRSTHEPLFHSACKTGEPLVDRGRSVRSASSSIVEFP